MTSIAVSRIYTIEEYFELEKNSTVRHEYYHGKLIEMPGESKIANQISKNILKKWDDSLEKQGYCLYNHDVKAEINARKIYRYPDLVVASEQDDNDSYVITKPKIMVEVASENSFQRDSVKKKKEYTAIESMQYYMIVSQDEMFVELCFRDKNAWSFAFYENADEVIELPQFDLKITLAEIYHRVKFGEAKTDIEL